MFLSACGHTLYWAMIQTVGLILFQVKAFWFWWRSIDIRPIDSAFLAHFVLLRAFGQHNLLSIWTKIKELMANKGTAYQYVFVFAKACPYLPALITIVQNSWQLDATKLAHAGLCTPYCWLCLKKDTLIWEQYVPFTDRNSEQNSPKWPNWEHCVPFTDRNLE